MMAEYNTTKIKDGDLCELVGQIIDIFEDFLEEKGIQIDNPEKDEAVICGEHPDDLAIIYGTDYGELQSQIEATLVRWKLAEIPWRERWCKLEDYF